MPMMPFIGVRISWLMLARNWLLARLAASAASRARSRTNSAFLRSVRSRVIFENPTSWPDSSRSAAMATLAQKREPSLRIRQSSSSKRPSAAATRNSLSGKRSSIASCG